MQRKRILPFVLIFAVVGSYFVYKSFAVTNNGIWVDRIQLKTLPTSGPAWDSLVSEANALPADGSGASVANQDSNHDQNTLAAALVCARTNDATNCTKAKNALVAAIGTEQGGRWLAIGRNMGSYTLAADVMNIHADGDTNSPNSRIDSWLKSFLTMKLQHNNDASRLVTLKESAWVSASNASAQEGFVHAAVAAYANNSGELDWAWNAFRQYAGDRSSSHSLTSNNSSWQYISTEPVGINDAGSVKNGCRMDGSMGNDMSRGGDFSCTPGHTSYPWVGLEGSVPAALILHRAGYPAFEISTQAIKRTHDYLWNLYKNVDSYWWDAGASGGRADEVKHLVNTYYGTNYTVIYPVKSGRTFGFTDWTHPNKAAIDATESVPPPPSTDTTAPAVSIASPTNGVTVSGTVNIAVNATDNIGVARVDLYRNNLLVGTDTTAPYGFPWQSVSGVNGAYTMYARAYDTSGNVMNSATITVNVQNATSVADTSAPSVRLESPTDGSRVTAKVSIRASASDNMGVTGMQILVDGRVIASSNTGSVSVAWNTKPKSVTKGAHIIVVRATDAAGNFNESAITVYK